MYICIFCLDKKQKQLLLFFCSFSVTVLFLLGYKIYGRTCNTYYIQIKQKHWYVLVFDKAKFTINRERGEKGFRIFFFLNLCIILSCFLFFVCFLFFDLFMYEIKRSIYHFHPPYSCVYMMCLFKNKKKGRKRRKKIFYYFEIIFQMNLWYNA
jgi:hypothetical protein